MTGSRVHDQSLFVQIKLHGEPGEIHTFPVWKLDQFDKLAGKPSAKQMHFEAAGGTMMTTKPYMPKNWNSPLYRFLSLIKAFADTSKIKISAVRWELPTGSRTAVFIKCDFLKRPHSGWCLHSSAVQLQWRLSGGYEEFLQSKVQPWACLQIKITTELKCKMWI